MPGCCSVPNIPGNSFGVIAELVAFALRALPHGEVKLCPSEWLGSSGNECKSVEVMLSEEGRRPGEEWNLIWNTGMGGVGTLQ